MTRLEKLFVQIFERKNGIIEQIKQQRDLYYKDLLSKSLIHGIPPPPWLWNYASSQSLHSDPKDLNKEELISELLFPHARLPIPYPTGQCFLYSKLVTTGDNGELLDELPKIIQDSYIGLDPVTVPESHGNDVVHTSGVVVQLDSTVSHAQEDGVISTVCVASGQTPGRCQSSQPVTAQNSGNLLEGSLMKSGAIAKCLDTGNEQVSRPACVDIDPGCRSVCIPQRSPQDQTDSRISNIYKAPDRSLVRIHRSKSRQKALELRTSAKAARKSCLSHEINTLSFSVMVDTKEPDHGYEFKKMEFSDFNRGSMGADVNGGNLSNKICTNSYSGRTTRSRSTCKQASSVAEPLKLDSSHQLVRKDDDTNRESCVTRLVEKSKENGTGSYCGRITTSKKDSEPFAYVHNSPAPHEPDVVLSDVCKSNVDMHHLKCDMARGSPELQIEEGHLCSESGNRREIVPCTLQQQSSGQSLITNLIKPAVGDPKKFLNEEVDMANPPDPVLDARTNCCCLDDDNSLLLEHKLDCENIGNLTCTTVTGLTEGNSKMFDSGLNTYSLFGDPHGKNEDFGFSKLREPQPTNKFPSPVMISSSTKVDSWPQFKRRMVEDKQINCLSASPKFRVQNFHNIQKGFRSSYSRTAENNSNAVSDFQVSPRSREGNVPSPRLQVQERKLGFEERITVVATSSMFNHENSGSYLVSSLSKKMGDSQVMLVDDDSKADPTSDVFAVRSMCDEQAYQKLLHVENNDNPLDADALTSSERTLLESKSHLKVASQLFSHSAVSPCINDLAFDQTLPVFESFVLNEQTESVGMDISEDGINFSELNHSCTSTQRASILEQLCRTASRQTPLPHISSRFEIIRTKDQYLSVQNGLEHVEMKSNSSLNDDGGYHLRDIFVDEVDSAFDKVSSSECLPYSDTRFGWNSKGSNSPPLGKLWERISSNSFSSEKRLSFNPELTCFPIEEDPSVSEENENADDLADNMEMGICSTKINTGANREPLSDITEVGLYPPASVSVAEKCLHRGRFDSINTEVFSTTFNSVKQRLRNHRSNSKGTNWQKENQNLSVGANSIKKVGESLQNRFSKARLSGTTSMKRRGQRPFEKVKRNNIVSNVTSFIPLVQQKQAAAVCAGKRDVKVKALEAAEAARHLEEKKENERKMKKEALKLERAKMEKENLRQKELDRKKKIEELKKKDADIIARKRLRDEEERKEKERKKKRIEEGRRVHRAQEEKVRAGKGLKEKLGGNMGKRLNDGQELDNRKVNDQDGEKANGNEISLNKAETEPKTKQASIISEMRDALSYCNGSRKSTNVSEHSAFGYIANKPSQEKSYEISPYQCSDNEEDEEEDLPTKKFVPSWASKNCVALVLSSQQQIDPSVIFPRESFCSMDEALLPRNLR